QSADASFILTCLHVVLDVDRAALVKGRPATLVAPLLPEGETANLIDLAVLRVEGRLEGPVLALGEEARPGAPVKVYGFRGLTKDNLIPGALPATLARRTGLEARGARTGASTCGTWRSPAATAWSAATAAGRWWMTRRGWWSPSP